MPSGQQRTVVSPARGMQVASLGQERVLQASEEREGSEGWACVVMAMVVKRMRRRVAMVELERGRERGRGREMPDGRLRWLRMWFRGRV